MAHKKLPSWAKQEGIIYPPHLNMEQCSSEQTARYKAGLNPSPSPKGEASGMFVDLTGGFGVDFYWMSQGFQKRQYIEQSEKLCEIARHNFSVLGLECSVSCCDTATYLTTMPHASLVYLDPARRNEHGGRTYGIEDCTPNVLELMPLLMEKADRVMLKLSPMLDWRKAVDDIQQPRANSRGLVTKVHEVHIVSVGNECKELLLVLSKEPADGLRVVCVNDDSSFEFVPKVGMSCSQAGNVLFPRWEYSFCSDLVDSPLYLYEPNASIMKAGCFAEVEERFRVQQIAVNSHLFLSSVEMDDFPGRKFQILAISSVNQKELKRHFNEIINQKLTSMESANIAVRNFPMSVDQLRKKLKLKDGGDTYIFATTLASGEHKLLICRKIG